MKKIFLSTMLLVAAYANAQVTESFPETEEIAPVTKGDDLVISLPEDGAPVDENEVYMVANIEVKPDYPGGILNFRDYIVANYKFENLKDGAPLNFKIYFSFIIEKDGTISKIMTLKEPGYGAGKELIRVLTQLKAKWSPAIKGGKPVRCSFNMPVTLNAPVKEKTPVEPEQEITLEKPVTMGDITISTYEGDLDRGVEPDDNEIYNAVTLKVQPEFPGGINAFRQYLAANIHTDNFEGAEGTTLKVYAQFIVEKDGTITGIRVLRDPGYGAGKSVEQILKSIKTKWNPGMQNGKPVRSNYSIPIAIVVPAKKTTPQQNNAPLPEDDQTPKPNTKVIEPEDNSIYNVNTLQVQPDFPGGKEAFVNFINKSIKKENLEGLTTEKEIKIFIQFIIEKDGTATNHKIVEAPNTGIMQEVLRVLMPMKQKWSPGKINGKPVRALYSTQVIIKVPQ